jgi:hypothetical protein
VILDGVQIKRELDCRSAPVIFPNPLFKVKNKSPEFSDINKVNIAIQEHDLEPFYEDLPLSDQEMV